MIAGPVPQSRHFRMWIDIAVATAKARELEGTNLEDKIKELTRHSSNHKRRRRTLGASTAMRACEASVSTSGIDSHKIAP